MTAGPAFLLSKLIKENLESLWIMGASLFIGGVIMWIIDASFGKRGKTDTMSAMRWPQAVVVGAAQILAAVFPGMSRSMSTIAGGQIAGMNRETALEFSFFLAIPTMFAACIFDLKDTVDSGLVMNIHSWGVLATGFVVSFFVAWAVIAWFMSWVRNRGFVPFAIYRIILGLAVMGYLVFLN